jgi:CRISPR/Cas system CSM-associated protein Csm3 (group 7 of RAMP superfamily)
MTMIELELELATQTAFHVGSGEGLGRLIDRTVLRTATGRVAGSGAVGRLPYLPGSTLKGLIRHRCRQLASALRLRACTVPPCTSDLCIMCRLFGSSYTASQLYFADALPSCEWARVLGQESPLSASSSAARTSVAITRAFRTAKPQALFTVECAPASVVLKAQIAGAVDTRPVDGGARLPPEIWLLCAGILWLDRVGGSRSRGFGHVEVTITRLALNGAALSGELTPEEMLGSDDALLAVGLYEAS